MEPTKKLSEYPSEIEVLIEEFKMLQERNASPEAFQMWHAKVREQYPNSSLDILKEVRKNLSTILYKLN